jgi:hypothetical protein
MTAPPSKQLVPLVCATLALGCGEPLSPTDVAGSYALQRVAGDSLPTVLFATDSWRLRVFAETLRFTSDGRGTIVTVRARESLVGGPSLGPTRGENGLGFRIIDGRIEVAFDCSPIGGCTPPPDLVMRRTAQGLRADSAAEARTPLVYARVP